MVHFVPDSAAQFGPVCGEWGESKSWTTIPDDLATAHVHGAALVLRPDRHAPLPRASAFPRYRPRLVPAGVHASRRAGARTSTSDGFHEPTHVSRRPGLPFVADGSVRNPRYGVAQRCITETGHDALARRASGSAVEARPRETWLGRPAT